MNVSSISNVVNTKDNSKNVSFKSLQKTFVMIKPEAFENDAFKYIRKTLKGYSFKIVKQDNGILPYEKLAKNYEEFSDREFYKEWMDYLSSNKMTAMVVEGENVVKKMLYIKKVIRWIFSPNEKRYNVMHCSDSFEAAKREIDNFFPDKSIFEKLSSFFNS